MSADEDDYDDDYEPVRGRSVIRRGGIGRCCWARWR